MPFDGLVLAAVRNELQEKLAGGRIEKIYQPEKEGLVLFIHRTGSKHRLILSGNARNARVHLTNTTRENPAEPPIFCMVLRKHLEGGRIAGFDQPGLERVLVMKIDSRDELGRPTEKHLICEIMGKHSNILLVEPSSGTIIDGIKRYSHAVSRHREVLPGRPYIPPPTQQKLNPLLLNEEGFRAACLDSPLETTLPVLLQKRLEGLSTTTCREIVYRANLAPDTQLDQCGDYELRSLWASLQEVMVPAAKGFFQPCLLSGDRGEPLDFAALDLAHAEGNRKSGEMNLLLDVFFSTREQQEYLSKKKNAVSSLLHKEMARLQKKLELYGESLEQTEEADRLRLYGELLTANLYRLEKGAEETILENYYEESCPKVAIPLKVQLTPAENAQAYFKKYAKAKSTREALGFRAVQVRKELAYLEGVTTALEQTSDLSDLAEVRQELSEQGYIKQPSPVPGKRKNKKEKLLPRPLHFLSSDGLQLFVGKNNRQNDYLTLKMAREDDIWLHTKDIPGAHVIIRTEGKEVPEATLEEAAGLAAYFSKGRGSKNVPVDYTLRKHVHKPRGARPGMVIYEHQRTIMGSTDESAVDKLRPGINGED